MHPESRDAFTLIELLVVIAIIGILVAIAVPNFLRAQARAKVARVKSEMRTVGSALELYRSDRGLYPNMRDESADDYYGALARLKNLTTPVSYISSVPEDIFVTPEVGNSTSRALAYADPYIHSPDTPRPWTYEYVNFPELRRKWNPIHGDGWVEEHFTPQSLEGSVNALQWILTSLGPHPKSAMFSIWGDVIYDPTNGTVSIGQIVLVGPGNGFLGKP